MGIMNFGQANGGLILVLGRCAEVHVQFCMRTQFLVSDHVSSCKKSF